MYQVPGTVPSGKPPKSESYRTVPCRTMQWKSAIRNALKSNVHINESLSPTRFKGTVERTGNDGEKGSGNVSIQTFPQKHQGPMCSNSLATSLTLKTAKEYQKQAARSDPPWPQFAAPAESQTLGVYGCLIGGKTALWTAGSRLHSDLLQITAK